MDKIIEQLERAREIIVAGKTPFSSEAEGLGTEACLILKFTDSNQIQTPPRLLL